MNRWSGLVEAPRGQLAVTAAAMTGLAAVLGTELLIPPLASLGAFVFVPVLLGGWLLAPRMAIIVICLAVGIRAVGIIGGVHPVTALAEATMLVAIGIGAIVAADRFRLWRAAQVRLRTEAAELAAAAERERIAQRLTETTTHTLFAVTLDLHAALSLTDEESVRQRLESASTKLDGEIASLREAVYRPR